MKTGSDFQECIRHINCMNLFSFKKVFGDHMGEHLWLKHLDNSKNIGKLIFELDTCNMQALFSYLQEYIKINKVEV